MRVSDALLQAAATDEDRAFDMINFWSSAGSTTPRQPGPGFSTTCRTAADGTPADRLLLKDFIACNVYAAGLERAAASSVPVFSARRLI